MGRERGVCALKIALFFPSGDGGVKDEKRAKKYECGARRTMKKKVKSRRKSRKDRGKRKIRIHFEINYYEFVVGGGRDDSGRGCVWRGYRNAVSRERVFNTLVPERKLKKISASKSATEKL